MLQKAYPLIGRTLIAPHTHSFSIDCPDMAALARPGQFVHVRLPGFLLRRPISVCQITQDGLRIVVEERGAGTEEMARLGSGDLIDLLGPLGNGLPRHPTVGRYWWAGIGTPPLLPLAEHYHKAEVFLGFRRWTEPSSPRTLRGRRHRNPGHRGRYAGTTAMSPSRWSAPARHGCLRLRTRAHAQSRAGAGGQIPCDGLSPRGAHGLRVGPALAARCPF